MTKFYYFPIAGVIAAACLAVTACGPQSSAAANTSSSSSASVAASKTASTVSTPSAGAPAATPVAGTPTAASSGASAEFTKALAVWKQADSAPLAVINSYIFKAADDLKAADDTDYNAAVSQLTSLGNLPATGASAAQQREAQAYVKELDTFFGTPGYLVSPSGSASPSSSSSPAADPAFTSAKASWVQASKAPLAMVNVYFTQTAADLKKSGGPGYATAEGELEYLASVPDSNASSTQIAKSQEYLKDLDTFFGTPGLNG